MFNKVTDFLLFVSVTVPTAPLWCIICLVYVQILAEWYKQSYQNDLSSLALGQYAWIYTPAHYFCFVFSIPALLELELDFWFIDTENVSSRMLHPKVAAI